MSKRQLLLAALIAAWLAGALAGAAPLKTAIQVYVDRHQREIVTELAQLLSIPDVASDRVNIRRKAGRLKALLDRRGVDTELLETEGNPPWSMDS